MAFYSNEELEIEMKNNFYEYKLFADNLLFYKERLEEEGVSPQENYDIIFRIMTDKYSSSHEDYFYRFRIERKYQKDVVDLFPITENPSLESTVAYKSILETCIYLSQKVNPVDKIYHSEIQLALVDDIESLMRCSFSKKIDNDFYLINLVKVTSDNNLKRYYKRLTFAPVANTLVFTEKM